MTPKEIHISLTLDDFRKLVSGGVVRKERIPADVLILLEDVGWKALCEALCEAFMQAVSKDFRCRVCGCTNETACPGGCHWVDVDLCSRCAQPASQEVSSEHDDNP